MQSLLEVKKKYEEPMKDPLFYEFYDAVPSGGIVPFYEDFPERGYFNVTEDWN